MAGQSTDDARSSAGAYPQLVPQDKHLGKPAVSLKRPVMLIGSRENCRIRLVSDSISAAHALLVTDHAGTSISDLGSRSHVYVNGQRRDHALLKTGDSIRVGSFTFRFAAAAGATGKPTAPPAGMVKVDGLDTPTKLTDKTLLIGRSRGTDVQLLGDDVSRRHAVIFVMDGHHCVRDIGSRTGTYVNGAKIHQVPLKFGDVIRIADHELRYQAVAQQEMEDELDALLGTKSLVDDEPAHPPQLADDLSADQLSVASSEAPASATGDAALGFEDLGADLAPASSEAAADDELPAGLDLEDEQLSSMPADEELSLDTSPAARRAPAPPQTPDLPRRGWRNKLAAETPVPAPPVPPAIPVPAVPTVDLPPSAIDPPAKAAAPVAAKPVAPQPAADDDFSLDDLIGSEPAQDDVSLADLLAADVAAETPSEAAAEPQAEAAEPSLDDHLLAEPAASADENLALDIEPLGLEPAAELSLDDEPVIDLAAPPLESEPSLTAHEAAVAPLELENPETASEEALAAEETPAVPIEEISVDAPYTPQEPQAVEEPAADPAHPDSSVAHVEPLEIPLDIPVVEPVLSGEDSDPMALHQAIVERDTFAVPKGRLEPAAVVDEEAAEIIEDQPPVAIAGRHPEPVAETPAVEAEIPAGPIEPAAAAPQPPVAEPETPATKLTPMEVVPVAPAAQATGATLDLDPFRSAIKPPAVPQPPAPEPQQLQPMAVEPVADAPAEETPVAAEENLDDAIDIAPIDIEEPAAAPAPVAEADEPLNDTLESLGTPVESADPVVASFVPPIAVEPTDEFELPLTPDASATESIDLPLVSEEAASPEVYELPLDVAADETDSVADPAAAQERNFTTDAAAVTPATDTSLPLDDDAIDIAEPVTEAPHAEHAAEPHAGGADESFDFGLAPVNEPADEFTAAPVAESSTEDSLIDELALAAPPAARAPAATQPLEPELHFDDLELSDASSASAAKPAEQAEPAIDLSDIQLDLASPAETPAATEPEPELLLPSAPEPETEAPLVNLAPPAEAEIETEHQSAGEKPLIAADAMDLFAIDGADESSGLDDSGGPLPMLDAASEFAGESEFDQDAAAPAAAPMGFEPQAEPDADAMLSEDAMVDDTIDAEEPLAEEPVVESSADESNVEVVEQTEPTLESALDFGTEVDEPVAPTQATITPSTVANDAASAAADSLTDTSFGREVQNLSGSDSLGPLVEDDVLLDNVVPPVDVARLDEPVIDEEPAEMSLDELDLLGEPSDSAPQSPRIAEQAARAGDPGTIEDFTLDDLTEDLSAADNDPDAEGSAMEVEPSLDDLLLETPAPQDTGVVPQAHSSLDDLELTDEPSAAVARPQTSSHAAATDAAAMPDLSDLDLDADEPADETAPTAEAPDGGPDLPPPSSDLDELFSLGRDQASFLGGMPLQLKELPPPPKDFGRVKVDFGQQPERPQTPLPQNLSALESDTPTMRKQRDYLAKDKLDLDNVAPPPPRPVGLPRSGEAPPAPTNPFDVGPVQMPEPAPKAKPRARAGAATQSPEVIPPYDPRGVMPSTPKTVSTPFDGLAMGPGASAASEPFAQMNKPVGAAFNNSMFDGQSLGGATIDHDAPVGKKAKRPAAAEEKSREIDTVFIPDAEPAAADDASVPRPLRKLRPEQQSMRPPTVTADLDVDDDLDDEPRRRRLGVPVLLMLMLVVAAGAWAGIYYFTPMKSRLTASMKFKDVEKLQVADRNRLNADLKRNLESNETRRIAAQTLANQQPGVKAGFLDDPVEYSRRTQKAALVGSSSNVLSFTFGFDTTDEQGDRHRVQAMLTAMEAANKPMLDKAAAARVALEQANNDYTRANAAVELLEKQINDSRSVGENRPSPATVAELEEKAKKAEKAWQDAVEARKALEAELASSSAGGSTSSVVDDDAQVKQLSADLVRLTAQRDTAAAAVASNPADALRKTIESVDAADRADVDFANFLAAAQQLQQAGDASVGQASDLRRDLEDKLNLRRDSAIANDATLKDLNDQFALSSRRASAAASAADASQEAAAKAEVEKLRREISSRQDEIAAPIAHLKSVADQINKDLLAFLGSQSSPTASADQLRQLDAQIAGLTARLDDRRKTLAAEHQNQADSDAASRQVENESRLAAAQQLEADTQTNYDEKNKQYLATKTALDNARVASMKLDEAFAAKSKAETERTEANNRVELRKRELMQSPEPQPLGPDSIATTPPNDMRLQYSLVTVGIIFAGFIILILMLPQERRAPRRHGKARPQEQVADDADEDEEPLPA